MTAFVGPPGAARCQAERPASAFAPSCALHQKRSQTERNGAGMIKWPCGVVMDLACRRL
jgi:hypothetical protein